MSETCVWLTSACAAKSICRQPRFSLSTLILVPTRSASSLCTPHHRKKRDRPYRVYTVWPELLQVRHRGLDHCFRCLCVNCIAVTPQTSHTTGSAINQRGSPGFNWPPPSIPAQEPISISPEAVSRAGPASPACAVNVSARPRVTRIPQLRASFALVVAQLVRVACRGSISKRLRPSGRSVFIPGVSFQSRADAVTQLASSATSTMPVCLFFAVGSPISRPSLLSDPVLLDAIGVGQ